MKECPFENKNDQEMREIKKRVNKEMKKEFEEGFNDGLNLYKEFKIQKKSRRYIEGFVLGIKQTFEVEMGNLMKGDYNIDENTIKRLYDLE